MRKSEIPIVKIFWVGAISFGKPQEIQALILGDAVFLMFSISSAKFVYVYFVAGPSPTSSNFSVLLNTFAQDFQPDGWYFWMV